MRMIIALNDKLILFNIDFDKRAAVDFGMLPQSHRHSPRELFSIGREANAFGKIEQKKCIRLGLLARCDIAYRDDEGFLFIVDEPTLIAVPIGPVPNPFTVLGVR